MKHSKLSSALMLAGITSISSIPSVFAYETENTAKEEIERVEVTGSRIKRADLETVSPIVVIDAESFKLQGHATVYDALNALSSNTGIFVGEENTNNFNANAQALNRRGFGSEYTLVLLNGRRVPVLPKPSGSVAGNVVNLAMIPTEAVKRVEVISGGASAIYGSDAVAGVVNVILKDDVDETTVKYRYGNTKDGGGQSNKFNVVTGGEFLGANYTYSLEVNQMDPVRGDDRDWFDDPTDSPDVTRHVPSQVMSYWARYEPKPWMLIDIKDKCESIGYQSVTPGWLTESDAYNADPQYCGDNTNGTQTIRNARDRMSSFFHIDKDLGDVSLFADVIYSSSEGDAGLYRYSYGTDYDVRSDINDWSTWQGSRHIWRSFRDFEVPTSNQEFDEDSYTVITGIEGVWLNDLDYTVSATYGKYDYQDTVVRFNDEAMMTLLFGEKGTAWDRPWEGSNWAVVSASALDENFLPTNIDYFGALSPDMFSDVAHESTGIGSSSMFNLAFETSGSIMSMPTGDLAFAFTAEYIKEDYEFVTDAATVNGEISGWSGIAGAGERDHYAIGVEFLIPLLDDSDYGRLEASVAGRYDYYDDESDVDGASTYQLGLTWTPMEDLMVRAMYATSFRAPDMHYMYAERSSSFNSGTDYLDCVQSEGLQKGDSWQDCGDNYGISVRSYSQGDTSLEEETGYSTNIGIVGNISDNWSYTLDYYNIHLEKQVGVLGANTVLRYEAECQLGFDQWGNDVDTNSAKCQEIGERVERGGPQDTVNSFVASPFNTGLREQKGIDFTTHYTVDLADLGSLSARLGYTHVLETNYKFLPENDIENIRDVQWNDEFRTKTNLTLTWSRDEGYVSAYINRKGTSPIRWADDENARYGAWTTVNLSAGYNVTEKLNLNLSVNNIFDKKPHQDDSEKWFPYANLSKYSGIGTEFFATATYIF